jgi:choline-sulfatase
MAEQSRKPDILLFLSDQHHGEYIGCKGHELVRTPNIDRLAADGTLFTNAYTACPLCVPARTAFLTGQLPSATGVYENSGAIGEDQATFIHSIAAEGYDTVLCGRMHFVGPDQRHGFTHRIMGEMTPTYSGRGGKDRSDLGPFAGSLSAGRCLEVIGGGNSPVLEYDRAVVAAALDYLSEEHERPQCIIVGTYGPHYTYVAPPELYRYYRERVGLPEHNAATLNYRQPVMEKHRQIVDDETVLAARAAYFGMIEQLDGQIGAVREAWDAYLQRQGREGLFIYVSDHGDQAGEHHYHGKQTFYEGSAKIPLIIAGNGLKSGARMNGPVSMIDLGPTLCEIVGADAPPCQDGRSLVPQCVQGVDDGERAVVSEYLEKDKQGRIVPSRMIRQGDWKLIRYAHYEENDILFNLKDDPLETTNVRDRHPQVYEQLLARLTDGWDVEAQAARDRIKQQHYRILAKWGKVSPVDEPERWPVPEHARQLPTR